MKREVFKAYGPYGYGGLGSFDRTQYMLLAQHNYPAEYDDEKDKLTSADHDRLRVWNNRFSEITKNHTGTGELGLDSWVQKATPEKILAYLIEVFSADHDVPWNGYRVMGSVHLGNGYPVFSMCLFYKHPDSDTKTYSGHGWAPNVEPRGSDNQKTYGSKTGYGYHGWFNRE